MNGRRRYLGPHGTRASKREYDRLIGEWLQRGRQTLLHPESGRLSVVELIVAYLHHVAGNYRTPDGTTTDEVHNIKLSLHRVKALYGSKPSAEFCPTALK